MNKNTINYMYGVAFGFLGIILYSFALTGYENVYFKDVIDVLKEAAMPFLFTELWVAIASEGIRNLVTSFKNQMIKYEAKKMAKKIAKEAEA